MQEKKNRPSDAESTRIMHIFSANIKFRTKSNTALHQKYVCRGEI